jgi:hypothetical protein
VRQLHQLHQQLLQQEQQLQQLARGAPPAELLHKKGELQRAPMLLRGRLILVRTLECCHEAAAQKPEELHQLLQLAVVPPELQQVLQLVVVPPQKLGEPQKVFYPDVSLLDQLPREEIAFFLSSNSWKGRDQAGLGSGNP